MDAAHGFPTTTVSPEIATEWSPAAKPRVSRAMPSEVSNLALSLPLAQPLGGLTKRYAAPWEKCPPTSTSGAAETTASPDVATDCPNSLNVPGSEVVSVAVSVSGPAQPEAGRLKT